LPRKPGRRKYITNFCCGAHRHAHPAKDGW
jgi:hypothetical protein